MRVFRGAEPFDESEESGLGHGGAAGGVDVWPALDVEENRAPGAGTRRVGVMVNFDFPGVGEVALLHLLFLEPRRRTLEVDDDVLVVVREGGVLDPGVRGADGMEGIIGAGGQRLRVSVDRAERENAGGRALVALGLVPAGFALAGEADAPREAVRPEKNPLRRGDGTPAFALPLEALDAAHTGVPRVGQADDQLPAIRGQRRGEGGVQERAGGAEEKEKSHRA